MVYFILGLLFGIPLSIGANILTPWIKNRYALSSQKRTAKRLKILEEQLADIAARQPMEELMKGLKYLFITLAGLAFGFFSYASLLLMTKLRESETFLQSSVSAHNAIWVLNIVMYLSFLAAVMGAGKGWASICQRAK